MCLPSADKKARKKKKGKNKIKRLKVKERATTKMRLYVCDVLKKRVGAAWRVLNRVAHVRLFWSKKKKGENKSWIILRLFIYVMAYCTPGVMR